MGNADPRRDLMSYRNARAALKARTRKHGTPCWLCGQPFDWSLHHLDAMAFTADHVTPLARGGHITGPLKPAHRRCNSRRNDGRHETRLPTTRRW
ncbi:HNH endonuclease [Promicromonospora kroppenstedtii]|uniref:HNH endonuclease n=1 Tax=Promicromonospora kroppenstedtii TaxID=440482 RepID=UPI0012FB15F1